MTARNDQPGGPWWRPAATENAGQPDVCASSSTMHYMQGSVSCGAQQGAGGVLLGTHHAIHFPGADEDEDDNDGENNNDNNKTNHNGNCHDMSSIMAPPAWEEAMFEKPLTPSDVGKLNRLVIPKQYAERYFPIDLASEEKGLQLCFEDEAGKLWRFRYSYWNSSQSYVLTKGWSRYVKDKRLDAGDVVSFHRGDRLYIRCRRSSSDGASPAPTPAGWGQLVFPARAGPPAFYPRAGDGTGAAVSGLPVARSKRVVRLFGVNLDCPAVEVSQPAWTDGL